MRHIMVARIGFRSFLRKIQNFDLWLVLEHFAPYLSEQGLKYSPFGFSLGYRKIVQIVNPLGRIENNRH